MDNVSITLKNAQNMLTQKQPDKAVETLQEAIKLTEDARLEYLAGIACFQMKDFEKAGTHFEKAGRLDPENPTIFNNLGLMYFKQRKYKEALSVLQKAIRLNSRYSEAFFNLGKVFEALECHASAMDAFIKCSRLDLKNDRVTQIINDRLNHADAAVYQKRYRNILIVMEEGIGNMVMLTPALRALKAWLPETKITVLGRQPSVQVIEDWECVDRIITEPDHQKYDLCFQTIWSGNTVKTHGDLLRKHCKEIVQSQLMKDQHESDSNSYILPCLGSPIKKYMPYCASVPADLKLNPAQKWIALSDTTLNHPAWQRKRWPYYIKLAEELTKTGYGVVLIGGKAEAEQFKSDKWPEDVVNAMGQSSIAETAGILKQCTAFIGNDSGPAHMAAAMGIHTLPLFGATLISKNVPVGRSVHPVSAYLPCSPCQYTSRWQSCTDWRCMKEIDVEHVLFKLSHAMSGADSEKMISSYNDNIDYWVKRYQSIGGRRTVGNVMWSKDEYDRNNQIFMEKLDGILSEIKGGRDIQNLLDFGCGIGRFAKYLKSYCNTYYGVDLVNDIILENKRLFKEKGICFGTINNNEIPFEGPFDIVWTNVVLQHVVDDELLKYYAAQFADRMSDDAHLVMIENVADARGNNYLKFRSVEDYRRIFDRFELVERGVFNPNGNNPHAILVGKKKKKNTDMAKSIYVVGMPRAGSVFFYDIVNEAAGITGDIQILNQVGSGKQHQEYSDKMGLDAGKQVFGIYRDIRDVVVSVYYYVMKHHLIDDKTKAMNPSQGVGKHPLFRFIEGKSFEDSIDILIEHPNCLQRYVNWFYGYFNKPFVHLIKYEELTGEEGPALFQSLFNELGTDISGDSVEKIFNDHNIAKRREKNPVHVKDGKIGKFKDHLTNQQIERIQQVYADYFKLAGYELFSL